MPISNYLEITIRVSSTMHEYVKKIKHCRLKRIGPLDQSAAIFSTQTPVFKGSLSRWYTAN